MDNISALSVDSPPRPPESLPNQVPGPSEYYESVADPTISKTRKKRLYNKTIEEPKLSAQKLGYNFRPHPSNLSVTRQSSRIRMKSTMTAR